MWSQKKLLGYAPTKRNVYAREGYFWFHSHLWRSMHVVNLGRLHCFPARPCSYWRMYNFRTAPEHNSRVPISRQDPLPIPIPNSWWTPHKLCRYCMRRSRITRMNKVVPQLGGDGEKDANINDQPREISADNPKCARSRTCAIKRSDACRALDNRVYGITTAHSILW